MMMGRMMGYGGFGNYDSLPDYMKQMMQSYYGGVGPFAGFMGIFELIHWILIAALLVAAIRYLWNKGGK